MLFLSACHSSATTQAQCRQLETYFEHVMSIAGIKPLLLLLFDDDPLAEFDEQIQEVKGRGLRNQLTDCFQQLDQLSDLRSNATIDQLLSYHLMEDQVLININLILFELFNFKLAPFLELKECAVRKAQQVEDRLKTLNKHSNSHSLLEEQQLNGELHNLRSECQLLQDAVIQLYEQFYRQSTDLILGQLTRMYQEAELLASINGTTKLTANGDLCIASIKSTHESRLLRLEIFYLQEKLKCLNVAKLSKLIERHRLKASLDDLNAASGQANQVAMERLQVKVKSSEIRLIDARMSILNEEESLLKKQISYLHCCDEQGEPIEFDLLACYSLDDGNWDASSFERQFDVCVDQIVIHLDFFKVKLRSLARKRAVFRTKRKLYVEEKKHNLGKGLGLEGSSSVDMAIESEPTANKSEQLRRSRAKALQRLRSFRRKNNSIQSLSNISTESTGDQPDSRHITINRPSVRSNGGSRLKESTKESNNELNSLFDSDFSSFSSNCSHAASHHHNPDAAKSDLKCNPNWISDRNNREFTETTGSDFTFQTNSGDSVIDTAIDHVLGKHCTIAF
jgi:hypothetical protein